VISDDTQALLLPLRLAFDSSQTLTKQGKAHKFASKHASTACPAQHAAD